MNGEDIMKLKITLLLPVIISMLVLGGCADKKEQSERCAGLYSVINNIHCNRYEFEVDEYLENVKYAQIGICVYYDDTYYSNNIEDLFQIKNEVEMYINDNTDMFLESYCSIVCYSSDDKEANIPIPYIDLYSDSRIKNSNIKYTLNCMEINSKCSYEQFNITEPTIEKITINYEFTSYYDFDSSILSCFPNLKFLCIPSKLCENEDIKKAVPNDCEIKYVTV